MSAGRRAWGTGKLGALALVWWAVVLLAGSIPGAAAEAPPPPFWQSPADGVAGSGAGQLLFPAGIGVQPQTPGHLFVADPGNSRIDEFDVWGQFKGAWGWEVVKEGPDDDAPVDARQQLTVSATSGTYELRYFNAYGPAGAAFEQTTGAIPFGASSVEIEAALVGLESFGPGDVTVSGGPGDGGGTSPYEIEFAGDYADTAIPTLKIVDSTTISGGSGASVQMLREGGSFEVCAPEDGDVCRSGQGGGYGPGGFGLKSPGSVAVDNSGGVYVFETVRGGAGEEASFRVQKFDYEGHFELMWGGEVDKTTHADRCTAADVAGGDVCGAGVPGTAPGSFEEGSGIAIGPEGDVFVGDTERIQKFDPEGHYLGSVALPKTVRAIAIDSTGDFYLTYVGDIPAPGGFEIGFDVHKLSPAGIELGTFIARDPGSVAVGDSGRVYTVETPLSGPRWILGYEGNGTCFICSGDEFHATAGTVPNGLAISQGACGTVGEDLYASFTGGGEAFLRAYGPQPDPTIEGCEPPEVPPSIDAQYAASVSTDGAVLKATINPHFWSGPVLGPTTYYVQYATAACIEEAGGDWEAGCVQTKPAPPGKTLEAEAVDAEVDSAPISLGGLSPATAYRYRFVAQSPGGGPVFGEGSTPAEAGAEGSFKTFAPPAGPRGGCENEALRSGPAALLPDCRAYEMVSPADKENGDIFALIDANGDPIALNQSSTNGDAFAYSSFRAFGDPESAPISSQYLARRGEVGWSSEAINPPRDSAFLEVTSSLNNEFKAFSPDLCEAWLFHESPVLASGAVAGFANLYRRQNCGAEAGAFAALTTIEPPDRTPIKYDVPELLGVSADGNQAIFRADDALPGTGAPVEDLGVEGYDLYETFGRGQVRFVCQLPPNGPAVSGGCAAGTGTHVVSVGRQEAVDNAISNDGSRIFWSDAPKRPGRLYVRIDGEKTIQLSSSAAQYWTAAADGSTAVFTTGEGTLDPLHALEQGKAVLHRYDVDKKHDNVIAKEVYGVMGASEDAERIYFASGEVLDGAPNSEGEVAQEGKPNLYLWHAGAGKESPTYTFIATLGAGDVGVEEHQLSPVQVEPDRHVAQVAPDGLATTFMSTARLTGADNTDLASGEPDAEVFHYDARSGQLACASCNPTNARPTGRDVFGDNWVAARIPGAQTQLYQTPRVLSTDGGRLFFESYEPLVANDTNGKADVYEWEGPEEGACETSSPAYSATAKGCVSLISSGKSTADATIADVSPSGQDVFFATAAQLLPKSDADGLYDIYDAREGGGFPPPFEAPAPCEGEACQSPPPAPVAPAPASSAFEGPENPAARKSRRCAKGKQAVSHHGKRRCVKRGAKKAHRRHRRAHANRRAAR